MSPYHLFCSIVTHVEPPEQPRHLQVQVTDRLSHVLFSYFIDHFKFFTLKEFVVTFKRRRLAAEPRCHGYRLPVQTLLIHWSLMSFNTERQIVSQVKRQIHFMKFLKKNKRMQYDDVTSRSIGPNPRRDFLFFFFLVLFFFLPFQTFQMLPLGKKRTICPSTQRITVWRVSNPVLNIKQESW